jgi:hypothetical protein
MEQPPDGTKAELSEYLVRQLLKLQSQIDGSQVLPGLTSLPTKPVAGKVYYFKALVGTWITTIGAWIYKLVPAGSFTTGTSYTIISIGTTNYLLVGGVNTVGTTFIATGPGTGTGTTFTWGFLG